MNSLIIYIREWYSQCISLPWKYKASEYAHNKVDNESNWLILSIPVILFICKDKLSITH